MNHLSLSIEEAIQWHQSPRNSCQMSSYIFDADHTEGTAEKQQSHHSTETHTHTKMIVKEIIFKIHLVS